MPPEAERRRRRVPPSVGSFRDAPRFITLPVKAASRRRRRSDPRWRRLAAMRSLARHGARRPAERGDYSMAGRACADSLSEMLDTRSVVTASRCTSVFRNTL